MYCLLKSLRNRVLVIDCHTSSSRDLQTSISVCYDNTCEVGYFVGCD